MVRQIIASHLQQIGHAVSLAELKHALAPNNGTKDPIDSRANIARSVKRRSREGGPIALTEIWLSCELDRMGKSKPDPWASISTPVSWSIDSERFAARR